MTLGLSLLLFCSNKMCLFSEKENWVRFRYICKHVCSYFPVILHVEDMKAFHPNRAYGLSLTPNSSLTSEDFSWMKVHLFSHLQFVPF